MRPLTTLTGTESRTMESTINEVTPAEYELEVRATADELDPKLDEALRAQRKNADMKGFRQGKVPLSLIKKRFGDAIGHKVAEQVVQERFQEEVEDANLDLIGQPTLTKLDYEVDGDLHAVIRFGVRPEVEIEDLSGEQVDALAYEVTDEDVEEEIENFLHEHADLVPKEGEPIEETDYVVVDLQRLDRQSGTPVVGEKEEGVEFFLDDEQLKDELREALLGKTNGASARVELEAPEDEQEDEETMLEVPGEQQSSAGPETALYEVTVQDVKRRDLPELDDAFVGEVTDDQVTSVEELRQEVRHQLEQVWEQQAQEFLQGNIVERMIELHPVPVPDAVIEMNLDAFVEDVEERSDGDLPENFDEQAFRRANRGYAEQQGRWMFIRDQIVEDENLEATEEEIQAHFMQGTGGRFSPDQLQQVIRSNPQIKEQVKQRVLSDKVFDVLKERFEIVERDPEEIEREMQRQQQAAAQQRAASAASPGRLP